MLPLRQRALLLMRGWLLRVGAAARSCLLLPVCHASGSCRWWRSRRRHHGQRGRLVDLLHHLQQIVVHLLAEPLCVQGRAWTKQGRVSKAKHRQLRSAVCGV
jgi:hypothetical protein